MNTYFALLTDVGEAKLANAMANGKALQFTEMGIGDGNGVVPTPDREQKTLVHEVRRANINQLSRDTVNANQIIIEQVLPESDGGFWVRELGLYDVDGDLCAVANCPPSYKPKLSEGSGRTQVVRMVLIVSAVAHVELQIDPAIVLATRDYAEKLAVGMLAAHTKNDDPHPQYFQSREQVLPGGLAQQVLRKNSDGANDWAWSDLGEFPTVAAAIPNVKTQDVLYIKGIGILEWTEVTGDGAFAGYRSLEVGRVEFGTSTTPRGYELDLTGASVSKTVYASLWSWAQQNGHTVSTAAWTSKAFQFADVDDGHFRLPDLRDVFLRFTGTNADSAAARLLGSYQSAAFASHNHGGSADAVGDHAHNYPYVPPFTRTGEWGATGRTGRFVDPQTTGTTHGAGAHGHNLSIAAAGGRETRPMNTAFFPRIHI